MPIQVWPQRKRVPSDTWSPPSTRAFLRTNASRTGIDGVIAGGGSCGSGGSGCIIVFMSHSSGRPCFCDSRLFKLMMVAVYALIISFLITAINDLNQGEEHGLLGVLLSVWWLYLAWREKLYPFGRHSSPPTGVGAEKTP